MKALLLSEYKKLNVVDMPTPEIGEDEVLVRVRACGICGSDIHGYDGSTGRRIPPLVMGHEAAGVIERAGRAVEGFAVGDRVTFDSTVSCGTCDFCRQGQINLCDNRMVLGVSCGDYRRHGAFAEYVSVPARILYKLPDTLPFERAALIEAVSIAVHAVSRHVPKPDDAVLVVGSGMIGVLVIQVLRDKGLPQHHRGRSRRRQARARDASRRHAHSECKRHRRAGCGPRAHRGPGRRRIIRSRGSRQHGDDCDSQPSQGRNGRADRQPLTEGRDTAAGGRVARDFGARLVRLERRNSGVHRSARPRRRRCRSTHQPEGVARRGAELFERLYGGDKSS